MDELELNNTNELTDEQVDAIAGGYIVDLSEWKGQPYYALVNDKTGRVIAYRYQIPALTETEEAQENSTEFISMDRYAELFGRKFFR